MNFNHILEHHLMDHRFQHMVIGGIDFGLSTHLVMLWIICAISTAVFSFAARAQSRPGRVLRGAVEAIVLYIREQMLEPVFHEATDSYLPYFLTLFFFILICNLIGLVPGANAITANITITASLALCTFVLVHFAGIKAHGVASHIGHIIPGGLPQPSFSSAKEIAVAPMVIAFRALIFVIEVIGLVAKCVALAIRLFANIISGHIVSLAFLSLIFIFAEMGKAAGTATVPVAVGLALFVVTLDILVAFLQAYIFTVLTALFVGGAVHPH